MKAGQKLRDSEGNQVLLFPLEYMQISQRENVAPSHEGTFSIDFLGWGMSGRILKCPYYCPADIKCVMVIWTNGQSSWQTVEKVRHADGIIDYACFTVSHDDTSTMPQTGDVKQQGDLWGYTGIKSSSGNVTGDHMHSDVGHGNFIGIIQNSYGNFMMNPSNHHANSYFVNDTIILNGASYDWKIYDGPVPPENKKKSFRWVLYPRRLRRN